MPVARNYFILNDTTVLYTYSSDKALIFYKVGRSMYALLQMMLGYQLSNQMVSHDLYILFCSKIGLSLLLLHKARSRTRSLRIGIVPESFILVMNYIHISPSVSSIKIYLLEETWFFQISMLAVLSKQMKILDQKVKTWILLLLQSTAC